MQKQVFGLLVAVMILIFGLVSAQAADRGKLTAFLKTTGFDVALDSIALSAADAPAMLGLEADAFGYQWTTITRDVFDTDLMQDMAIGILEKTMPDDLLDHAAGFYASDLGQRLVAAENLAHMDDDDQSALSRGESIIAELVAAGSPRVAYLRRMGVAIDVSDMSVRAVQEIQVRFLLAAAGAGVIELHLGEDELRSAMSADEASVRLALRRNGLANSAFVYREFSDDDLRLYAEALEDRKMQQVYELMNAIQFEIMADRFERLAQRMGGLRPSQEL